MHITVAGAYPEVGINFPISYKFNKLLREAIHSPEEDFSDAFQKVYGKEYSLGIILSAKEDTLDLIIKGPSISKRYKAVDYVLYIPFCIIHSQADFFINYVNFVCDGIKSILEKYSQSESMYHKIYSFREEALKKESDFIT